MMIIPKTQKIISNESVYRKCKNATEGTPQHNVVNILFPVLEERNKHLLDDFYRKRLQGNEFHQRRNELYIASLLNEFNGSINIDKFHNGGPDFKITTSDEQIIFLECICPPSEVKLFVLPNISNVEKHKNKYILIKSMDALYDLFYIDQNGKSDQILITHRGDFTNFLAKQKINTGIIHVSPESLSEFIKNSSHHLNLVDQMKICITNSIKRKLSDHLKHIEKNIIASNSKFIIAIGLSSYDLMGRHFWDELVKHTLSLFTKKTENLSGVLLTKDSDQTAMTFGKPILFNDFYLIHNPFTLQPLSNKELDVFKECIGGILIENKPQWLLFNENLPLSKPEKFYELSQLLSASFQ